MYVWVDNILDRRRIEEGIKLKTLKNSKKRGSKANQYTTKRIERRTNNYMLDRKNNGIVEVGGQ
jgi:hypothetical protein